MAMTPAQLRYWRKVSGNPALTEAQANVLRNQRLNPPAAPAPAGGVVAPPPHLYNPALDAQERAAGRGYDYLVQDIENVARPRGESDYLLGQQDITRSRDRTLADILRQRTWGNEDFDRTLSRGYEDFDRVLGRGNEDFSTREQRSRQDFGFQRQDINRSSGRALADILTGRTRNEEDFQRSSAGLARSYQRLGNQQRQVAGARGVRRGGTLAAALAKRQENEAWDRQPLETARSRYMQDSTQAETRLGEDQRTSLERLGVAETRETEDITRGRTRLGEDVTTGRTRLGQDVSTGRTRLNTLSDINTQRTREDADIGLGRLSIPWQRQQEDWTNMLAREGRELGEFKIDTAAVRNAEAAAAGWVPPQQQTRPSYLPPGYETWDAARRSRYWASRR